MKRADFIKLAGATAGALIAGIVTEAGKGVPVFPDGIKTVQVEFKPKEPYTDKDIVVEVDQDMPMTTITIPYLDNFGVGFDYIAVPIVKDSTGKKIAVISHENQIQMGFV